MEKKITHRSLSLIEILMIVSLIAVLLSIAIVAINPINHFAESKNALRFSHANALSNAIYQYELEHGGRLPLGIEVVPHELCKVDVDVILCAGNGFIDLSLLAPRYIPSLPIDPLAKGTMGSGYSIKADSLGKVTITALYAENGDIISVSR